MGIASESGIADHHGVQFPISVDEPVPHRHDKRYFKGIGNMSVGAIRQIAFAFLLVCLTSAVAVAQQHSSGETPPNGTSQPSNLQYLINVLRDDKSREILIGELQKASATIDGPFTGSRTASGDTTSIGHYIAEITRNFAQTAVTSTATFVRQLSDIPSTFAGLDAAEADVIFAILRNLAFAIMVTYGVFILCRMSGRRIDQSFGRRASAAGFVEKAFLVGISVLLNIAIVIVAWAAGYLAALTIFGELGQMDIQQTLYLNAFTVVQLAKVALRAVFSPSTPQLRLIRISDRAARRASQGFSWIVNILGYGQLLLQPILTDSVSEACGQAMAALVALSALLIAIGMTFLNRQSVTEWFLLKARALPRQELVAYLARRWHWPVLVYLGFIFCVVLLEPASRLFSIISASAQVIAIIVIGVVIADWLSRAAMRGVSLPVNVSKRLPLLQKRVDALVPRFLTILRFAILLFVGGVVLAAIGALDIIALFQSPLGIRITSAIVSVILIIFFAYILWLALTSWVDFRLNPDYGSVATAREATLLSLLRNASTIAIVVIALMFSLSELGLDIAPLLASAGVLGLAIGFGAQKLVQDVITGVFIQFENAINVGDVITVGQTTGTVERLTIRSMSLRDDRGAYHIISLSSVDMITNLMRDFSYHIGDIGLTYREDVEKARLALFESFEQVRQNTEFSSFILGDMEWFGIQELADQAVIVRVKIKTLPGKQWVVGRALNGAVKRVFDSRDIEMQTPYQSVTQSEFRRRTRADKLKHHIQF